MNNVRIALVGLENHGEQLLERLLRNGVYGPGIVCVVPLEAGPGFCRANTEVVAVVGVERLVELADGIDIILDFSGDGAMHRRLHQALAASGNHHTRLLSERARHVIDTLLAECPEARAA